MILDKGYLRYQREWRQSAVDLLKIYGVVCYEVESEIIVPVAIASEKSEYSAATLRPKILRRKRMPALLGKN